MTERDIFIAALQRDDPGARGAYLAEACGADYALRARLEELLGVHDRAAGFLESPPAGPTATADMPTAETVGTVIGPYKLLEPIGEGGFGVVFLAEQCQPVRRRVALKVLKPGMDTKQVVARFEAEQQALALMDHPNIAKVLDGGATLSGRPYFVMELVRGTPITDFCDHNHLTPRQRLELFVQVCRAVQHAHQKGIIHRDLKPSNVLVSRHDTMPVVKVIDFGVAKALGQELTDKTLFTGVAQMIGTPLYMSPEQAGMSDRDVDTRSDIYALGVLLYELLTGTTPFDKERLKGAGYDEIRRIIREEEPPRPSTRLSTVAELVTIAANRGSEARRLSGQVRGELDWLVMKSLEKDRNRRYDSANALAADVQRYLAGEAVQAVPPSTGYRLRKFARRNRRALAAAAGLLVALLVTVGAVAGSVGWAARNRAARQAAVEKEAELALGEAERFLEQEKWPEALDAAKRGEGLLAGSDGEVRGRLRELRNDLEMLIRLDEVQLLVVDLQRGWHEWDAVHDGYAKAFADYGIDVLNLPAGEAAARIRARPRLADPLAGALDLWACTISPKTESRRAHLRAVAGAVDPEPWRRRVRAAVERKDGSALAQLAAAPDLAGQSRNGLIVLEHGLRYCGRPKLAIEVCRTTQRHHPEDFWANYSLAHELFWSPGADFGEVASFARAAVAARPKSAAAHLLLALALHRGRKLDEAAVYHLKAIELAPNNPFARHDYAAALHRQGKYDEALAGFRQAIELWPENFYAYWFRGHTLRALNRLGDAAEAYRTSVRLNPSGPQSVPRHHDLGRVLLDLGKNEEAVEVFLRSAELNPESPNAAAPFCDAVRRVKKRDEAVDYFEAAAAQNRDRVWLLFHIAFALNDMGEREKGVATFLRALEVEPSNVHVLHNLGWALHGQGKYDEALVYYDRAIALDRGDTWAYLNRGRTLRAQGNLGGAAATFRQGTEVDPNLPQAHLYLADVLLDLGEGPEAFRSCREVLRLVTRRGELGVNHFGSNLARISLRLALAPDPKLRHPALAVELAREAVRITGSPDHWSVLGVASYRAGSFGTAATAIERATKLRNGAPAFDWFVLALSHFHLGNSDEARQWYDKAVARANTNRPTEPDFPQFRAEAEERFRIEAAPPPRAKP